MTIGHNPYFSRRFFAIPLQRQQHKRNYVTILILVEGSLQYDYNDCYEVLDESHNPYFSRRFFAIKEKISLHLFHYGSQSLF